MKIYGRGAQAIDLSKRPVWFDFKHERTLAGYGQAGMRQAAFWSEQCQGRYCKIVCAGQPISAAQAWRFSQDSYG